MSGYSQYPSSVDTYTYRQNVVDNVDAFDVNELQDGVESIETTLGTNPQGSATNLAARLNVSMSAAGAITTPSTTSDYFQIDSDGTSAAPYLSFGGSYDERITWSNTNSRFQFSDDVYIGGTLSVIGNFTVTGNFLPSTTQLYTLGSSASNFESLWVDGGATHGGRIYFDGNSGRYIQSSTDGLTLSFTGFTTISSASNIDFDGGSFTFNNSAADKDFLIKGDTDTQLFKTDAGDDAVLIGANANTTDFTKAKLIVSHSNSGDTDANNVGIIGEALVSANAAIGIRGSGAASATSANHAYGVNGVAIVTNATDAGICYGIAGNALSTHTGADNIAVFGNAANASGSGKNYSFYGVAGDMFQDGAATFNNSAADKDFLIKGDTDTQLFKADAGDDAILIGANANTTDYSGVVTKVIISNGDSGDTYNHNFALVAESSSALAQPTGVYGVAKGQASSASVGIHGKALRNAAADTGVAYGSIFESTSTHTGANNTAVYATASGASGSGKNYSFYGIAGDMFQDGAATFNNAGADKDFLIKSDDDAQIFKVDGGDDSVLIGANANTTDFTQAKLISSAGDTGQTIGQIIGVVGEATGADNCTGVFGVGKAPTSAASTGIYGIALRNASADTGPAYGGNFTSAATHAGGNNTAVYGSASNGANNYSFYGAAGNIYNAGDLEITGTATLSVIAAFSLSGKLTAGANEIEGSNFDINGGTADGLTSLTMTTQTRYLSIPGNAFISRGGDDATIHETSDGYFDGNGATLYALAAVNLPHGAAVTQIDVKTFKNDTAFSGCYFYEKAFSSAYGTGGTSRATGSSTSSGEQTMTTAANIGISNSTYYYWIRVVIGNTNDYIEGALITYTVTSPLP